MDTALNQPGSVPWSEVWRLYFDHGPVFRGALASLRASGVAIPDDDAADLVHEFLLERAPHALATFRPERGSLPAWLFVVFKRFVVGTRRTEHHRRELLERFRVHLGQARQQHREPEFALDTEATRVALAALAPEQQRALRVFLGEDGTVRRVAGALGTSRWKASRLLVQAGANVALALGAELGVTRSDLELLAKGRGGNALGRLEGAVAQRAHRVLAEVLEIERGRSMDPHKELLGFLASPEPRRCDGERARTMLDHASRCQECAAQLRDAPAHAELLLETLPPSVPPDPEVEEWVRDKQEEYLQFGDAMLRILPRHVPKAWTDLPDEARAELWAVDALKVPSQRFRCGIAAAEMTLALRSFLAGTNAGGTITQDGLTVEGKTIPAQYFSSRIAEHARVNEPSAAALWGAFVTVLFLGKTGLPGVHLVESDQSSGVVTAVED